MSAKPCIRNERSAALKRLEAFALDAAEFIRPRADRLDRAGYGRFLNTMYHYTRHTGDKALAASRNCPEGELRSFFEHMQDEEQSHYRLAESDLEALGHAVHPRVPEAVQAFDRYWASIRPEQYPAYLGALVVFENVARHVGPEITALIRRLQLDKTQCRWLRVHAQADQEHGRQALALGEAYLREAPEAVLDGAARACELWKDIFRSAFEDRTELPRASE